MGVYSSTVANAYADKIKAVYEYLDEIKKVADRLTPVEDLTSFQAQIEAVYTQLDLLVETANLIATATPTGEAILTGSVASIKTLLEIGVIPSDLVRQADLDAALAALQTQINTTIDGLEADVDSITLSVTQLDQFRQTQQTEISGLQLSYTNLATGQETNQTNVESALSRLTTQEQWTVLADQRFDTINQSLADTILGVQATNNIVSGHTANITTLFNTTSLHTSSIDQISSDLVDINSGIAAHTSALSEMETTILGIGDDIIAQSNQTTALKAAIGGSGNLLPNADFGMNANGWNIVVAEEDWATSMLTVDTFAMPPEVHCLEVLGTPTPLGQIVIESPAVLLEEAAHYIVSGYPCVDNGTVELSYKAYDSANLVVDQGACPATFNVTTNANFYDYARTFKKFLAPAGAVKLHLYLTATGDGDFITQAALFRPMVERAWAEQVGPSAWTPNISGIPEALATAVQTLEVEVSDINGELSALSTAQTELISRVGTTEASLISEMITSANKHAATVASINSLSASMIDVEAGLATQGTAVSTLQTDVGSLNGTVSSHSTSLTSLQAQVDSMDTDTGGFGSAIAALDVRVTANEDSITSMSSSITALESSVVSANKIFAQAAPPSTSGRFDGDLWFDTDDGNKPYVLSGGSWIARQDLGKNTVFCQASQPTAKANNDIWIDTDNSNRMFRWTGSTWVEVADTRIASTATAVTTLTTRVLIAEGDIDSQATSITTLSTTVNGHTASISSQATSINGLQTKWTVTSDVNGYITGLESINNGSKTEFNIRADKFKLSPSSGSGARTEFSNGNWRIYDASNVLRVSMGVNI